MKEFVASVELDGESFDFHLCERQLYLGVAGKVRYYWMDNRPFRSGRGGDNFRPCVEHWWAARRSIGWGEDEATRANLVMAEIYPLFNTSHAIQGVFLDANLSRKAKVSVLDDEEARRLRRLAGMRDPGEAGHELARLFLGERGEPDYSAPPEIFMAWLRDGMQALRAGGLERLRAFVGSEVRPGVEELRQRGDPADLRGIGGEARVRLFLNRFGYEAKLAFYETYSRAWIGLIDWLIEHRGLDPVGARLLTLMHVENPIGCRLTNELRLHNQLMVASTATPSGRWDVLRGRPLALHPLSRVLQKQSYHRQAVGAWIGNPAHEVLMDEYGWNHRGWRPSWQHVVLSTDEDWPAGIREGACRAYADLVASILMAAHEYKRARTLSEQRRGKKSHRLQDRPDISFRDAD